MFDIIYRIFGSLMEYIYYSLSFNNYGVAIIIFTIITKLILTPLTIHQLKSSRKMSEAQEELAEIQRLFKGDRERMYEETQKIYKEKGISQTAGCLPLLLQFPIIIALYAVVRQPITYILDKAQDVIVKACEALSIGTQTGNHELELMNKLLNDPEAINKVVGFERSEIINFNFLGINLGMTPTINTSTIFSDPGTYLPLLLIPVLAAVTTYLQSILMAKMNGSNKQNEAAAKSMKFMNIFMPVIIAIFAFSVPAALGLYWVIGNIFQIVSQFIINKVMNRDKDNSDKKDSIIKVKGKNV